MLGVQRIIKLWHRLSSIVSCTICNLLNKCLEFCFIDNTSLLSSDVLAALLYYSTTGILWLVQMPEGRNKT